MGTARTVPLTAVVLAIFVAGSGCLFAPPPAPKFALTLLTDSEVNAQPNWTVGWALEVYQALGDHQNATLTVEPPQNWNSRFLKSELSYAKSGDRHSTFLLVDIPPTQDNRTYDVKIHAAIGAERVDSTAKVKVSRPQTNLVHNGTVVKMDYVGFLETNEVFDTSMFTVANSTGLDRWPDFKNSSAGRTKTDYQPLQVTLGIHQVILGWEIGLQNMSLGQGKALVIPPDLAYGRFVEQALNLTNVLPIYNTTTVSAFSAQYGFAPAEDMQFIDPVYEWTDQVVNVDNTTGIVTVKALPNANASYTPYGVNATVTNISSAAGTFELHWTPTLNETVQNQLDTGVITSLNDTGFVIRWQTEHRQTLAPFTLYFLVFVRSAQG